MAQRSNQLNRRAFLKHSAALGAGALDPGAAPGPFLEVGTVDGDRIERRRVVACPRVRRRLSHVQKSSAPRPLSVPPAANGLVAVSSHARLSCKTPILRDFRCRYAHTLVR